MDTAKEVRENQQSTQHSMVEHVEQMHQLVSNHKFKFLTKWHGPYEVVEKVGPVKYKIRQLCPCRIL